MTEARRDETESTRDSAELDRKSVAFVYKAALLDSVNDAIFVKASDGTILYWNQGAERLYGWTSDEACGRSTQELLRTEYPIPAAEIELRDEWEGELLHTKRDGTQITVASRWTTLRDVHAKTVGWIEINTNITARKRAEEAIRRLTGRILSLQDEQRRRIARDLHDSLGQYLTALKINLDLLSTSNGDRDGLLSECRETVEKCLTETRTISQLLHPPLLDEAGFGSAARCYTEGFAQRSGLNVTLKLPPKIDRLHPDVEIALFRAMQEALINVHRHSGGSAVEMYLTLDGKQVRLEIRDNGKGIPQNRLTHLNEGLAEAGVGIVGMRERVRQLGGSLEIRSDPTGTSVIVSIPLGERALVDPARSADSDKSASAA